MTVELCETRTKRRRTIQVAGIGAFALLTVCPGLGCSQTIKRTPVAQGVPPVPPPTPPPEIVVGDGNPDNKGSWNGRPGGVAGSEAPPTPISPSPLEVAIGPRLKVGTWNGWRVPIGKAANERAEALTKANQAPDAPKQAAATIPMPKRMAREVTMQTAAPSNIPLPKRPATSSGASLDETVLAASKASKIAPPLRHLAKPDTETSVVLVKPSVVSSPAPISAEVASKQSGIPMPVRPSAEVQPTPVASDAFQDTRIAPPHAIAAQVVKPDATSISSAPVHEMPIEPIVFPNADASASEPAPEPASSPVVEEPTSTEATDAAPSFEPAADTAPAAAEPSENDATASTNESVPADPEPTLEPSSKSVSAPQDATAELDGAELPAVVLPEFDADPSTVTVDADPAEKVVHSSKVTEAGADKQDGEMHRAAEMSKIPLPVKKRTSRRAKNEPSPSIPTEPVIPVDALPPVESPPAELDPSTFQGASSPPPIPS